MIAPTVSDCMEMCGFCKKGGYSIRDFALRPPEFRLRKKNNLEMKFRVAVKEYSRNIYAEFTDIGVDFCYTVVDPNE